MMQRQDDRWFWGLITLGVLIRLRVSLANRSLWLDEAMLALNIRNRSFAALTQPLDMDQIAPVGFLWLERASILLLGESEWALRLIPLLCGLALLPVTYMALHRLSNPRLALGVLAALALHPQLVYFSQEVKPYGIDALALVVVLALATSRSREVSARPLWSAFLAAGLLPWISLTSVFVLPGFLLVLIIRAVQQRTLQSVWNAAVTAIVFVLSCALEYRLVLRYQFTNTLMQSYWSATFPDASGGTGRLGPWLWRTVTALLHDPVMLPSPLALPAVMVIAFGLWFWYQKSGAVFWIASSTIALGTLAGVLRCYPPQGRLWMFAVPVMAILIVGGIEWLASWLSNLGRRIPAMMSVVAVGILFGSAAWTSLQWAVQPDRVRREDVRGLCEFIVSHRHTADAVYVSRAAGPALLWYMNKPELKSLQEMPITWGNAIDSDAMRAESEIARCGQPSRLWMLFAHTDRPAADPHSDASLLRQTLERHATSVILHRATPNDFEHEPAWTELFLRHR